MLEVNKQDLRTKLTSRIMSVGMSEQVNKTLNVEQADATRDALAKAVYYRLFEYLVKVRQFLELLKMLNINIDVLSYFFDNLLHLNVSENKRCDAKHFENFRIFQHWHPGYLWI